jgi:hypothetical protein
LDVLHLAGQHAAGHLGLHGAVAAGGAAAHLRLAQGHEREAGDPPQQGARRLPQLLGVHEVARVVVGDGALDPHGRLRERARGQEFAHVLHALAETARPSRPFRIVRQQRARLLEMGAAPGRVDDHRHAARPLEGGDVAPQQRPRALPLARVQVQRAAAGLARRLGQGDAVGPQHIGGRGVNLAEGRVHDAARQQRRTLAYRRRGHRQGGVAPAHRPRHRRQAALQPRHGRRQP